MVTVINSERINMMPQGVEDVNQIVAQATYHEPLQIDRSMEFHKNDNVIGSYPEVSDRVVLLLNTVEHEQRCSKENLNNVHEN